MYCWTLRAVTLCRVVADVTGNSNSGCKPIEFGNFALLINMSLQSLRYCSPKQTQLAARALDLRGRHLFKKRQIRQNFVVLTIVK